MRACKTLLALLLTAFAFSGIAVAQTAYGVGDATGGGTTYDRLFSVNPATGAATNICGMSFQSAAAGVSPVNGLVYYVEFNTANPDLNTINPTTCLNGTAVPTTLPTGVIRATFCPDGRLYAGAALGQFYELNPATGATIRTVNYTGLPTGGSGDFTCINNGDFYVVANTTNGGAAYSLFRINGAALASAANGGSVAATTVGGLGAPTAGTPNGLTEVTQNLASCAAAPNPCLIASVGLRIWGVNVLTGAATDIGATGGHTLADLSRSYPIDVSISKTATPTVALQGQTITYTLLVSNLGPGVASNVTVTDVLSPATYASTSWSCVVVNAGTATTVPTACSTPTGSGSINDSVSLSIGGSLRYSITAALTTTFVGTATNVARATITALLTDPVTANNVSSTASSTVTPAALIQITKTDGIPNVTAGATISYQITAVNSGPANAPGAVVTDPPSTGLRCTTVTCSATAGASCPAASFPYSSLAAGVALPTFSANSTATFQVTCGVTATGLP